MDLAVLVVVSLILGSTLCLLFVMNIIFRSHQKLVDRALEECRVMEKNLGQKIKEFSEVTAKASSANMSLGSAITDFDIKIKDLENRIAITRMQR